MGRYEFTQSEQFEAPPVYCRVRSGQMSMTWETKDWIVELLTLSRKSGCVARSSGFRGSISVPACPKLVVRKVFSSVLFVIGRVRFAKAARTSFKGLIVGLEIC